MHGTRSRRCDASAPETPRSVRLMVGLEPMQLLHVKQILGEQYSQGVGKGRQVDFPKRWIQCMFLDHLESTWVMCLQSRRSH